YIAPEQWKSGRDLDTRADIYSLGCTLYFLLAGTTPFPTANTYELLNAHVLHEPPPLEDIRPDLPAGLGAGVAQVMAQDPAPGYQRPIEVAQALAPFIRAGTKATAAPAGLADERASKTEVVREEVPVPAPEVASGPKAGKLEGRSTGTTRRRTKRRATRAARAKDRTKWLLTAVGMGLLLVGGGALGGEGGARGPVPGPPARGA